MLGDYHTIYQGTLRAIVTKAVLYWHKYRHVDPWHKTTTHKYSHLVLDKVAKNEHGRKDSIFNHRCWENWVSICRRMKFLRPICLTLHKYQLRMEQRPQCETWKHRNCQKKPGRILQGVDAGQDFLSSPFTQELRPTVDKGDVKPLRQLSTAKETVKTGGSYQ